MTSYAVRKTGIMIYKRRTGPSRIWRTPPPPFERLKGRVSIPISREREYFCAVCLGKISRESREKGVFSKGPCEYSHFL